MEKKGKNVPSKKKKKIGFFRNENFDPDQIASDFDKASKTVKKLDAEYGEKAKAPTGLEKKVSILRQEKARTTIGRPDLEWQTLSKNYILFVENLYQTLKKHEKEVIYLDLSGMEHVTDAVFGCLLEKKRLPVYDEVQGLILTGCYQMTDIGFKWIAKCFPNLKEVSIDGCLRVTETGLFSLVQNCKDLKTLDLTATNVMVLPSQVFGMDVDTIGCPLISPSDALIQKTGDLKKLKDLNYKKAANKNLVKVCLVHQQKSSNQIMPMITGEAVENDVPVSYKDGVKLKNSDIMANVVECQEDMMSWILSKRSIVVVVYSVDGQTEDEITSWLFTMYCQIIQKVNKAHVIFLALVENAAVKVDIYTKAFNGKVNKLKDDLKRQKETLLAQVNVQGSPKDNPVSHLDQMSFIHTKTMMEALEEPSTQFLVAVKENTQKLSHSLKDDILKAAEKTFEMYPEYEELSDHIFQYICSDTSLQMFRQGSGGGVMSLEGGSKTTDRTMKCLHYYGRLFYYNKIESSSLIIDPAWFPRLLKTVTGSYQQNIALFAAVSETSNVVLLKDIEKKAKEVKLGEENPLGMLTTLDLGLASRSAFIAYRDLEPEPPVPMVDFIGEDAKVQQIRYTFRLYHGVSAHIMADILKSTSNIRRPIMFWQYGVSIIENLVQVVIQLNNKTDTPSIELLVQSANMDKGNLTENIPKMLIHTGKKFKMLVDYVLNKFKIPYQISIKEKLLKIPEDIHAFIIGHKMVSNEGAKIMCNKCSTSSRQSEYMMHVRRHLVSPETAFQFNEDKDTLQKGSSVLDMEQLFRGVEKGAEFPPLVFRTWLGPHSEPEISFTLLDLKNVDVTLELQSFKVPVLTYSFKTGQLTHGTTKQQLYKHDQLGKTTTLKFTSLPEGQDVLYMLKFSVDGESQVSLKLPAKSLTPVIRFGGKKADGMKGILMVHGCGLGESRPSIDLQPGMKLEALDKKNAGDLMFCVATITQVDKDARKVFVHFDGWNSGSYDYSADMDFEGLHPLGWFKAHQGGQQMTKFRHNLQPPKNYRKKVFDWAEYCAEENSVPVPFEFFNDAQRGICTEDETLRVYDYVGHTADREYNEMSPCSERVIPGYYMESRLLKYRDSINDELLSFYSNHRQFIYLLPEKFDLNHLRFPSLTSMMNLEKQKVHFICPGHRMELLHLVDHGGFPLRDYMESLTDTDLSQLYAYLEMIYMGLLVQPSLLPTELGNLCPGADKPTAEKMELLEMGFKRVFFQYLIWTYAYNNSSQATGLALKAAKVERSTTLIVKILMVEKSEASLKEKFNLGLNHDIKCHGHAQSVRPHKKLSNLDTNQLETYADFMHKFELQGNDIEELPANFFTVFKHLNELNLSDNKLSSLPEGFSALKSLEILDVSSNNLNALPKDFLTLAETLEELNMSSNPLSKTLPDVFSLAKLRVLKANNIGHISLKGIGKLEDLSELYVASNLIEEVPNELEKLTLVHLDLSGIPWFPKFLEQEIQPNFSTFKTALMEVTMFRNMTEEELKKLFASVDKDANGILDQDEIKQVNKIIYEMYPRLGRGKGDSQDAGFPPGILAQSSLESLTLRFHGFTQIPDSIGKMSCLESLDISHNPDLETLTASLGGLNLRELHLNGCPSLKTPPKEIVDRGFAVVFGYLKRLLQGSMECKRTKLMVVGLGGAGKTSLIRTLTNPRSHMTDMSEMITDGIDITTWNVPVPGKKDSHISYSVWDFAGQTVYYNTHQFFLSNRAVYLLLWNIRLGFEHAGLDFWLNSIACHAPKAPILVVGTHCDKVEKSRIPQKELMVTYPQIAGFHFVSSYTGEGIKNLYQSLVDVTLQQKYMGEKIPVAWLNLEKAIVKKRQQESVDLIPLDEVKVLGYDNGILEEQELTQAVQFLHDLGSVQFFNTDFLRSLVVIVPQWIVDVMACVVTVHVGPIQEGKLLHKDMKVVWANYPAELHPWLLRLTEEFDLTFPMADEEANLVPCLLPDTVVEIPWPAVEEGSGIKETRFLYKFKYLPAGLFNRAQVRLHQFSESGQLWKKGMYLKKNNHIAVIQQKGQTMLEVKVQGFRPDNILFLVDEVISTLIVESYTGVNYDLLVPCPECQNLGMHDPSMFPSSKIYRAVELNAPFLQCDKMFHVLSIAELKALIPPNKTTEFDDHLRRSVMELKDLGEDVKISVIFCYSKRNIPSLAEENKLVHPGHIIEDLRKDGFNVSVCDNPETADVETLTIAFKSSQVIMFGASDEFCSDETCRKLLIFAKETLNKPILLVILGKSIKFLEGSIGLNLADEVFVKMTDINRYEPKIKELKEALKKKKTKASTADNAQCFVSYCWSNSHDAIANGSAKIEGALGASDPRELAKKLQEKQISTWLDIQRVGNVGLFDDIAEGLKKAKVMVSCVSDEYANSKNCKMEFRFAVTKLRIPTILAVVGTGYNWERSEIGMLAVGAKCPKINFQVQNEAGFLQLFQEIQKYVKIGAETKAAEADEEKKKNAFGEILESAERQFLRHLIKFKDQSYTADFPRLVVIDLVDKQKQNEEKQEENKDQDEDQEVQVDEVKKRSPNYCFSLLCESEEGWHDVGATIPFPDFGDGEEEETYLSMAAPYAARINAILKYSGSQMGVIATPAGKQLIEKLETLASNTSSEDEVEKAYNTLIKDVTELDEEKTYGGLKKTSLLNGKSLWLCTDHRKKVASITEQRYQTQLKSDKQEQPVKKATPQKTTPKANQPEKPTEAAAASKDPTTPRTTEQNQPKSRVFQARQSKSGGSLKRQTSQACSVM